VVQGDRCGWETVVLPPLGGIGATVDLWWH
jgi:hypothetical protein